MSHEPAQYEPRVPPMAGLALAVGASLLLYAGLALLALWVRGTP